MHSLPDTILSIGDPAVFQISTVMYRLAPPPASLFERTVITIGGVCIGNTSDCEISGITSSNLIDVVNGIKSEPRDGKTYTLQLGSNFDNYWIQLRYDEPSTILFNVTALPNENLLLKNYPVPSLYFSYLCEFYSDFVQKFKKQFELPNY
jgi:hypothetical protein